MTILARVNRLLRADIHHFLDFIEEPEAVLKLAVRDMESALAALERRRSENQEALEQTETNAVACRKELATADEQIEAAFQATEEKLAKTFIRKRLELQRRLTGLGQESEALVKERTALDAGITTKQRQLEDVREKARLFESARVENEKARASIHRFDAQRPSAQISDQDVEIAFIQEKERRGHHELSDAAC